MTWRREVRWNAHELGWSVGGLFIVGSFLFALGSFPPYALLVDPRLDASTFALGSVFFTSAAYGQFLQVVNDGKEPSARFRYIGVRPASLSWWAAIVQLAGTVLFNISTFSALIDNLDPQQTDQLVWVPDVYGSIAFLIASAFAWAVFFGFHWCVRRDDTDWWISILNGVGSIFFMLSAIAAFVLPTTGEVLNIGLVNLGTFVGAVGFLVGGYLLWPPSPPPQGKNRP